MNLHCLSFFQSQKIKIMSDSCHFHGSFMALSHTSLTWVQSAKIYWKSYPKSRCWLSICFFCLISAPFLAICQIHVGFMALSWHFHGAFFLLIFIVFPNSFMALACQIHGTFMALSWHFPGTFLALFPLGMFAFAMKMPWKCHESAKPRWNLHVRFMSICVCLFLSICRQCFFWCYFHWWLWRFRLINFFWGFLWSKYRVIRNTQTTNPNPQLVFSWCIKLILKAQWHTELSLRILWIWGLKGGFPGHTEQAQFLCPAAQTSFSDPISVTLAAVPAQNYG